jgi:septal ring factor EnvC (AmiA/AmiB activator)
MSDLPDDPQLAYVSKATFLHLWEKFKQQEKDLAEAQSINQNLAKNVLRLGSECRDWFGQVDALKQELARVMEDLHTANDALAGLRSDHKWLISCHKTQRSAYAESVLGIVRSVTVISLLNDKSQPSEHSEAWTAYEAAVSKATDLFNQ